MPKILEFKSKKNGKEIVNGSIEIKSKTANSAELFFYGDIVSTAYNPDDWWSSGGPEDRAPQDVADFLNELDSMTEVDIHINSGGGDVFAGVAIYNILKKNTAKKTTYVDGLAASAASIIALAGNTVIIPSSAQLMIHNPWTNASGNANGLRSIADMLDQVTKSLINIYMENVKDGITEADIRSYMDSEKWFTGEEAAKVFNVEVDNSAPVAAKIDSDFFNNYKNTPKNLIGNGLTEKTIIDEDAKVLIERVNNTLKFEEELLNE